MQTLAEKFLSIAEQREVTEVVHAMELATSGEIVAMITSRSHAYPQAALLCGLFLSTPLSLLFTALIGPWIWIGGNNMWLFLAFWAFFFAAFYGLTKKSDQLTRFFLNRREVEEEVRKGALTAFYAEKLHKTAGENGILIYISVLEQKVWILADAGINKKIEPHTWDALIAELTRGIKAGNRCQALCAAIRRTGEILQNHFPHQRNDQDELHNLIIR